MAEQHADQGRRKLFKTMAGMTWKERFSYFFYYYGVITLVAVVILAMLGGLLYDAFREKPEVLFNGMTVNIDLSEKAEAALTDGVFELLGGEDPEKQKVTMDNAWLSHYDKNIVTTLTAQVAAGQVDYILADQDALDYLAPWDVFTDLTLFMSQEDLEPLKPRFAYGQRPDGSRFPLAINLAGTAFAKELEFEGENLYIAFPGNTDRVDDLPEFLDYLLESFGETD